MNISEDLVQTTRRILDIAMEASESVGGSSSLHRKGPVALSSIAEAMQVCGISAWVENFNLHHPKWSRPSNVYVLHLIRGGEDMYFDKYGNSNWGDIATHGFNESIKKMVAEQSVVPEFLKSYDQKGCTMFVLPDDFPVMDAWQTQWEAEINAFLLREQMATPNEASKRTAPRL